MSLFISFEGGEGSGKTTQIKKIRDFFVKNGKKVLVTREPGGTKVSEKIREILVSGDFKLNNLSEVLLQYAARIEHINNVIKPAIERGEVVLCDRFFHSTFAYQGFGQGVCHEKISKIHDLCIGKFKPDITFYIHINPEIGIKRSLELGGNELRFEKMNLEFHRKVVDGFLSFKNDESFFVIDGEGSISDVYKRIENCIVKRYF